jgi:hypothetical protein
MHSPGSFLNSFPVNNTPRKISDGENILCTQATEGTFPLDHSKHVTPSFTDMQLTMSDMASNDLRHNLNKANINHLNTVFAQPLAYAESKKVNAPVNVPKVPGIRIPLPLDNLGVHNERVVANLAEASDSKIFDSTTYVTRVKNQKWATPGKIVHLHPFFY